MATYAIAEDMAARDVERFLEALEARLSAFAGRMTSPGTTQPWAPGDNPLGSRATGPTSSWTVRQRKSAN